MNQEEKMEKKLIQLKEKRDKLKAMLQVQTGQLKKTEDEISALELKKNTNLLKNFQLDLKKEGLPFDQSTLDEVLGLLRTKKTDDSSAKESDSLEMESSLQNEQENSSQEETQNINIPAVPDARRF